MELVSKVSYLYDEGNFSDTTLQQNITATQHDIANYPATFIIGRGNLTSTKRWNVELQYQNDPSQAVTSSVKYNITGNVVAAIDPLLRTSKINYTDVFNSTPSNRGTYAYPTTLTDAAGNSSSVKYRYDIGANVWAQSPAPAGNTVGKTTERIFDFAGRIERERIANTGAYTRYEYHPNGVQSRSFSTVVDVNNSGSGDTGDEVMSESWTDGAGRVRFSRTEHPNSQGGWSASRTEYDSLGRVKRSTVPTEVADAAAPPWNPTGDDAVRGWLWTSQEYDWKGRVVREVNTDGTDRLMSYQGCGCAGGEVMTMQSELVSRDDQPTLNARRTQRIYADVLGRNYKSEVLNWDGAVYTSTLQTFNGRDQVVKTTQYPGAIGTAGYQDVLMTYDGHGRMKTRHYPIEDALANTSWIYNVDDSIQQVIDPRGAITNFTYADQRGLLTNISYTQPANNPASTDPRYVAPTAPVSFEYDNVGNRKKMTDGTGVQDYFYDSLSRITSETKTFSGLASNTYTISYTYNLGGGLKSYTDPFGSSVNYTNDKSGRIAAVSGTPWAQNPSGSYANTFKYRAFGQIKQLNYTMPAETSEIKLEYDNRLRVNHFEASQPSAAGGFLMKANHAYFSDGRTQAKDDLLNDGWDRTLKFDFAARLKFSQFGMAAGSGGTTKRIYEETIDYDAFSLMTSRNGAHWGGDFGFTASYVNGRKVDGSLAFDAAGNITSETHAINEFQNTTFDAAGRKSSFLKRWHTNNGPQATFIVWENQTEEVFDGDGHPVLEKVGQRRMNQPVVPPMTTGVRSFQIWSSVLGNSIADTFPSGNKFETRIYANGTLIARQKRQVDGDPTYDMIEWATADPVTGTTGKFNYSNEGNGTFVEEIEPLGQKIHPHDPVDAPETTYNTFLGSADDPEWQCEIPKEFYGGFFGMPDHCQTKALLAAGTVLPWEFETRENPLRTTGLIDSPIPRDGEGDSRSDKALAFALGSSSKDKKKKKPKVKPTLKYPERDKPKNDSDVDPKTEEERMPRGAENGGADLPSYDPEKDDIFDLIGAGLAASAFIMNRTKFIGFSNEQQDSIFSRLVLVIALKPCRGAIAGFPGTLSTTIEVLRNRGITYVNAPALEDSNIEKELGFTGEQRRYLNSRVSGLFGYYFGAQAITVVPVIRNGGYMKLPNQRIITVVNFGSWLSDIGEDIPHELIHAGGVEGKEPIKVLTPKHDLSDYGSAYERVLKGCAVDAKF